MDLDPNSNEYKAFFLELAKSYNEEVESENLHRDNLFRHIIACMAWIGFTIVSAWVGQLFPAWLITGYGIALIVILGMTLYSIKLKHKRHVERCLHLRHMALTFKDGRN